MEKRFKKIVEWDNVRLFQESIKDNQFLWVSLIFMIPIVGQLWWLSLWVCALRERRVYWKEVKFKGVKE